MKLSIKGLALAGGIFWGGCLGIWTLALSLTSLQLGRKWLELMVGTYPFYEITPTGALVGLGFGFIDGFIACAIFAALYNLFAKKA
ncbi:MAG: hypothetical protein AAB606_00915 [Patescibacteria group bacterium]